MSDIEREEFEQAVADKWSDSYKFTRFGDEDYYDEVLEGMWWGWQASREALEGEPTAIVNDSGVLEWYPPYNRPPAGTKLYTHPASEATGDDQAKADERISVHEYTARMSLEALKFYTEWMQRNDCGEPEPIEHFYAMQAIEEIESLLPEPPKQEQSQ
jgi:hypothetical protein